MLSEPLLETSNYILVSESEQIAAINLFAFSDADLHELAVRYTYMQNLFHEEEFSKDEVEYLCNRHLRPDSMAPKDAVALRNMYKTFFHLCSQIRNEGPVTVNKEFIKSLHASLSKDLMSHTHLGRIRDYNVTMGEYTPPFNPKDTERVLNELVATADTIESPTMRAIYLSLNMESIQPFADNNKRTARMVETAVLLSAGIAPTILDKKVEVEIMNGCKAQYYKSGSYSDYAKFIVIARKELAKRRAML